MNQTVLLLIFGVVGTLFVGGLIVAYVRFEKKEKEKIASGYKKPKAYLERLK